MKKIISILLLLCMLAGTVSLFSCNPSSNNTDEPSENPPPEVEELNIPDDNYRNWYEIFVYSYYDTNNDGIGDINGVIKKLDYIQDMGFTGIWLMPVHPTTTYHKYDVIDYFAIDETYGTLDDFKRLVDEAHKRDIKIIMDLVLNHSSSDHKWFREACAYIRENGEPGGEYGDYYNFTTNANASGYEQVTGSPYYYECQFWGGMPDLNLGSEALRAEIVDIMDYWLNEYGVDGFRLDAVKEFYTGNITKNVETLKWVNDQAKALKPDCYIVGEAWEASDNAIKQYYGSGIDSFFLFTGATGTGTLASIVKLQNGKRLGEYFMNLQSTYAEMMLAPFLGNHDTMRPASFIPGEEKVKMAGGVLSMMNGGTFVYYGEEIGMISRGGNNSDPHKRIAMKWQKDEMYSGMCYTTPENITVTKENYLYPSVEEQLADEGSILNYYKQAMKLRNRFPAIARGEVENFPVEGNSYVAVITKTYEDEKITIVINLDSFEQELTLDMSTLGCSKIVGELYATDQGTASLGENGAISLPPMSIVILK